MNFLTGHPLVRPLFGRTPPPVAATVTPTPEPPVEGVGDDSLELSTAQIAQAILFLRTDSDDAAYGLLFLCDGDEARMVAAIRRARQVVAAEATIRRAFTTPLEEAS